MTCLVVAATSMEIKPFLERLRQEIRIAGRMDIDIMITGVGLLATTYHLQQQIMLKRPDLLIQAGIGGSFSKDFIPGEVVVIKKDTVGDQGVIEGKRLSTVFDMGFSKPNGFPFKNGWLSNPHKFLLKSAALRQVSAISVNQVSNGKKTIELYRDKFNPVIESMEGAAAHYVCLQENIPFLQLRGVSNFTGERNKGKWKLKESIINLNNELFRTLKSL